jgi:abortive infection bacteriophage resistance protein
MRQYEKPALSAPDLLQKLKSNGLIVHSSDPAAIHILETIGYYRLSAYFYAYKIVNRTEKNFKNEVSIEDIVSLYSFDRELRLLVLDPIEMIEIALRAALTNVMSLKYGSHWYLEEQHFTRNINFNRFLEEVEQSCKTKKEEFLKHYYAQYKFPSYPPSWMMMECLSLGTITQLLMNIRIPDDKKAICSLFTYHPTVMESWFNAILYTRNLCAHHSRFWNRWFVRTPIHPHSGKITGPKHSFCEQASIIATMMAPIHPEKMVEWKNKLYQLFLRYPKVPKQAMGFNLAWEQDSFWSNTL